MNGHDDNTQNDWIPRTLRFCFLLTVVFSMILSFKVLGSCEMIQFEAYGPPLSTEEPSAKGTTLKQMLGSSSTLGLFRYNPGDSDGGCRSYELSGPRLGASLQTARSCGVLAATFGSLALLMVLVEFLCCRFWCSRSLIMMLLFLAFIAEAMTMTIMVNSACLENKNAPYLCEMDRDSVLALVACGLYLLSTFLSCLIPRPIPLARVVLDSEKYSTADPCCFCWSASRSDKEDGVDDEDIEENVSERAELLHTAGGDQSNARTTVKIQQYYDSKAGVTLQDQSIAAYKRLIEYEYIYDKTLERFKMDCGYLNVSWQDMQTVPPDEIEDYNLRRTAVLLRIQNNQCHKVRQDLEHFEDQLEAVKAIAYFDHTQKAVKKDNLDITKDQTKNEDAEEKQEDDDDKEDTEEKEEDAEEKGKCAEEEREKRSYFWTLIPSFLLWKGWLKDGDGESSKSGLTGKDSGVGLAQTEVSPSELDEFKSVRLN